jgi:hypothetical protein
MALTITQTDTAGVAAQSCNGRTATGATSRAASPGGTAGSTPVATGNQNSGTHLTKIAFSWTPDAAVTWNSGTWTIRVNVTTGNTNLTIEDVCIRRLNSADADQGSIGQATAQAISGSAGVKSINISGAAQTPAAGDKVLITLTVSNASGQMNQQFSWTPDQDVDSPFSVTVPNPAVAVNDTGTPTEQAALSLVRRPIVNDTVTGTESVTVRSVLPVVVNDADAATEFVRVSERIPVLASDTVSAAESVMVRTIIPVAVNDAVAATEQITLAANPLTVTVNDLAGAIESVAAVITMRVTADDLDTASESVAAVVNPLTVNVSNADLPAENADVVIGGGVRIQVAEVIAMAEQASALHNATVVVTDTTTAAEAATAQLPMRVIAVDESTASDQCIAQAPMRITTTDENPSADIAQVSNFSGLLTISVSEARAVTERILAGRKTRGAVLVRSKAGSMRTSTMTGQSTTP